MAFVLNWQRKLGYRHDPFVERPSRKTSDYLVDRDKERHKLNLFVIKGERFGLLVGPNGSGKTTLLNWLKEELGLQFSLRTLLLSEAADPEAFRRPLRGLASSLLQRFRETSEEERHKQLIESVARRRTLLLVDNAQHLAKENKQLLKELAERGVSMILAVERTLKEHEQYGEDALGVTLEPLPPSKLKEVLAKRIALAGGVGTFPFTEKEIQSLATKSISDFLEKARARAMELSLTVEGPPPAAKPHQKQGDDKQAAEVTQKTRHKEAAQETPQKPQRDQAKQRFSIRFTKQREGRGVKLGNREEAKESRKTTANDTDPSEAALLNEMVNQPAEVSYNETVQGEENDINNVIEELVEEMEEKK